MGWKGIHSIGSKKAIQMIYSGKIWKFGDNISTDIIMPGSTFFTNPIINDKDLSKYSMMAIRPKWASQVEKGDIIVAGKNFGCGSGRPASKIFIALGISVVVAESTSRIFFRNSIHLGFPIISCPGVSLSFEEGDTAKVNIITGEVRNLTRGITIYGDHLPENSPPYQIFMAGGIESFLKLELQKIKSRQD